MCSTPDVPTVPDRQAVKLPDQGVEAGGQNRDRWRRAMMAGLVTGPQGALGTPNVAKPTLG